MIYNINQNQFAGADNANAYEMLHNTVKMMPIGANANTKSMNCNPQLVVCNVIIH